MRVIVHGGAGSQPARGQTESDGSAGASPDDPPARQQVLDEAAATGAAERTVTDAVCAAVRVLEASPRFNAGVGSAVQSDGIVRTDAGLMTDDREAGAVCSMPGVERAVVAARVVKEETPHVLVSGVHAVDLAEAFDLPTDVDLWTAETRERWEDLDTHPPYDDAAAHLAWVREQFGATAEDAGDLSRGQRSHDTVGAVARDGDRLAAATSTGGRWCALAGRVGDVPQVGSGYYCSRAGGASATGAGEDIARVTLARRAVDHLEYGRDAEAAADLAIEEFEDRTGSTAGVIVMGNDGAAGSAYNSELMQTAIAGDEPDA